MLHKEFSTIQIAKMLGVSRRTICIWIDKGKLKCFVTPGGHRRVLKKDLIGFIECYRWPMPDELKQIGAGENN